MNVRVEAFIEQARSLTQAERVSALDALQELVVPPNNDWEAAWGKEAADRVEAYERGELAAEDFDLVMDRLRKEFLAK